MRLSRLLYPLFVLLIVLPAAGCDDDDNGAPKENSVALCTDGLDNDEDSAIDCDDPDCASACASIDTDGDGVPDFEDVCEGHDDTADDDDDGIPDGCDLCAGYDDTFDDDGDFMPDGCDVCDGGNDFLDTDDDGVPDDCDVCASGDDMVDTDEDGVPDACDICEGSDDAIDTDEDSIPDDCDICDGGDDTVDTDGDGTPDDCDDCPLTEACNLCYQASYMLEETCGFTGATAAVGWDCTTDDNECEAQCALDSDCATIATLVGTSPDPDLSACMNACDPANGCNLCTGANCNPEFTACTNDSVCAAFLQCSQNCTDSACIDACGTSYPSTLAVSLETCMCSSCSADCATLCQ